jgi:Putative transposase of IS4/5 family (DUF4096)
MTTKRLIQASAEEGGKPRVDDRRIISGILHRFRKGLRWRALPDAYGPRIDLHDLPDVYRMVGKADFAMIG